MRTVEDAKFAHSLLEVAQDVYVFRGYGEDEASAWGANAGIVVGSDGVLLVDTRRSADQGRELAEAIRRVSSRPVRWVVNTHAHSDHSLATWIFADAGAAVIRHPACEEEIAANAASWIAGLAPRPEFAGMRIVAAERKVRGLETLRLGGHEVVLAQARPGSAHTAGDLVAWLPDDGVLFAGDLVVSGYHPNVAEENCDLKGWLEALEALARLRPAIVVPGHGDPGGAEIIEAQAQYLRDLDRLAAAGKRRGAGVLEVTAEMCSGRRAGFFFTAIVPRNVERCWRALESDASESADLAAGSDRA